VKTESEQHDDELSTGNRAELVRLLGSDDEKLVDGLLDWRYATVARVLAEVGAIHPKVHTPTRIVNYLERHGWQRIESPQRPHHAEVVFWSWSPPSPNELRWVHPCGIELDAPLCDGVPRYAEVVRVVVNRIVWAATGTISAPASATTQVLLEIAQQANEVAW